MSEYSQLPQRLDLKCIKGDALKVTLFYHKDLTDITITASAGAITFTVSKTQVTSSPQKWQVTLLMAASDTTGLSAETAWKLIETESALPVTKIYGDIFAYATGEASE